MITASPLESEVSASESVTMSEVSTLSQDPVVPLEDLDIEALLSAAKTNLAKKQTPQNTYKKNSESNTLEPILPPSPPEDKSDPTKAKIQEIKATIASIPTLAVEEDVLQSSKPYQKSYENKNKAAKTDDVQFRTVADPVLVKQAAKKAKASVAGDKWFNMPSAELTPELKRDLQLLQMRQALDPKRHYKKNTLDFNVNLLDDDDDSLGANGVKKKKSTKNLFVQQGTIVEDKSEFFSARMTNKERKKTFAQELLASDKTKTYFKRKYEEILTEKSKVRKTNRKRKY